MNTALSQKEQKMWNVLFHPKNLNFEERKKPIDRLIESFHDPSKNPYLRIEGGER